MNYDIYFSTVDHSTVFQLPVIPETLPEIERSSKNEIFETFDGEYNIIGPVGLGKVELKCWLPPVGKNYRFAKVKDINPDDYINFIYSHSLSKKPIRLIISRSNGTYYINELFSIDSFKWFEDKIGRYQYELSFTQWREF